MSKEKDIIEEIEEEVFKGIAEVKYKKEYKPVMVIYFEHAPSKQDMDKIGNNLNNQEGIKDYPKLIVVNAKENKVEIISVDKATVVEDIQKYIDLRTIGEEKSGNQGDFPKDEYRKESGFQK